MSGRLTFRSLIVAGVAISAIGAPLLDASQVPATAQAVSISVELRTALEPYGSWQRSRRWGEVWVPANVARDWRPYTIGHWVFSEDYGWYWVSNEEEANWGLVTFHYGRWITDDDFGWAWVPGNTWGPGWVQWRRGGDYVGWAALPPDEVAVQYRERPQLWVLVRERDLIAPRITEVILPPQEREVYFRDTVVVNRTVVLEDRRFAVNPGISPTYVAAAYGRPIPRFDVRPHVLAGTAALAGAIEVRAQDIRNRERAREITRESTFVRETSNTIQPARNVPPPQALGPNERGRFGDTPLRAAQGAGTTEPGRPNAAPSQGLPNATSSQPSNLPSVQQRQGAVPARPLQQEGDGRRGEPRTSGAAPGAPPNGAPDDRRHAQPQDDRRNQREGRPGIPGSPPATSGAARNAQPNGAPGDLRGVQPGRDQPNNLRQGRPGTPGAPPTTSGAAPSAQPAPGNLRNAQPGGDQPNNLRQGRPETRAEPPNVSTQPSRPPRGSSGALPGREERDVRANRPGNGAGAEPVPGTPPSVRERGRGSDIQRGGGSGVTGPQGGLREPSREPPAMGNRSQPSTTGAAPRGATPGAKAPEPGRREER